MAYTSTNPRFNTTIFTDVGAGSVTNPPVGANTLLNRLGQLYLKNSAGTEVAFGSSVATPTVTGTVTTFVPTIASAINVVSSANYTFTATDGYSTILVSTGSSSRTITLPAGNLSAGRAITIIKTDSGTGGVILSSAGSETLQGYTLSGNAYAISQQYGTLVLVGDGTNWNLTDCHGDFLEQTRSNSDLSITSGQAIDGTTSPIAVGPGVWDIQASAIFNMGSTTTVSALQTWIGTATGNSTTGQDKARNFTTIGFNAYVNGGNDIGLVTPVYRVAITAATNYYVKLAAFFGVSNMDCLYAHIRAIRV